MIALFAAGIAAGLGACLLFGAAVTLSEEAHPAWASACIAGMLACALLAGLAAGSA